MRRKPNERSRSLFHFLTTKFPSSQMLLTVNLKQSIRQHLRSSATSSASRNTKHGSSIYNGFCISSHPVCVAIHSASGLWHVYILASSLGFKTFRVAVSFLVFFWRLLEVVLSLLMVPETCYSVIVILWCHYYRLVPQFPVSGVSFCRSSVVQNKPNWMNVSGTSTLLRGAYHPSRMSGFFNEPWTLG